MKDKLLLVAYIIILAELGCIAILGLSISRSCSVLNILWSLPLSLLLLPLSLISYCILLLFQEY